MSKPLDFKLDTRIRDRLLRSGDLTKQEVEEHLRALPDLDGDFDVLSDIDQPAVAPARVEPIEEPIVFEGIRRLHALADASSTVSHPSAPQAPSPEPFRSALAGTAMESEISGVGMGAVSAALGAMAAESGHAIESPFASFAKAAAEAEAVAAQASSAPPVEQRPAPSPAVSPSPVVSSSPPVPPPVSPVPMAHAEPAPVPAPPPPSAPLPPPPVSPVSMLEAEPAAREVLPPEPSAPAVPAPIGEVPPAPPAWAAASEDAVPPPEAASPEAVSPEAVSPEAVSPEAVSSSPNEPADAGPGEVAKESS